MEIKQDDIRRAKEKLGDRNADLIIDELGIRSRYDTEKRRCLCPFHEEKTPSFVYRQKFHDFKCYGACGRTYDLIDAYLYTGSTFAEACEKLFREAGIPYQMGEKGVRTQRGYRYPHPEPEGPRDMVYAYLAKRCISKETADRLDIRQDRNGNCVFNYYDTNDVLTMVKYRPSHKVMKHTGEAKNWTQKDADVTHLLFNMNRCTTEAPLLITCGELDCAAAVEAGWMNSVSVPLGEGNTKWCDTNKAWLDKFEDIIIVADNDETGAKYLRTVVPMLHSRRCRIVDLPRTVEVEIGGEMKTRSVKDLNEYLVYMGKERTLSLIASADYSPIRSVSDLSDVEPIEYEDVDGVQFGIKPLDDVVTRLFFSTLTIISGRPGAGKSSLLGQLMCNAMDAGYSTWIFSGELPNGMNKSWLNYILAGRHNIVEKVSRQGNPYWQVTDRAICGINSHYKGKWFVYRDDWDNDMNSLMESMEDVVCRWAVKLLILDNFMCIDSESEQEEIRAQTNIIKRLVQFAKEYQVAVVLVCHPRKFDSGQDMDMYDIAGSSNIVNLAHRTISLRRVTDSDRERMYSMSERRKALMQYDVILTVVKDRMFGRQNISVGAYYDPQTRRFYTSDEEFDIQYGWDRTEYPERFTSDRLHAVEEVLGARGRGPENP